MPRLDPNLYMVLDSQDHVEQAQALHRLRAADDRTLVVEVGPDPSSLRGLGHHILTALGKDSDVIGAGRNSAEVWNRCQLWLTVENVERLIVTRAHNLRGWMITDIVQLAVSCQVELWLIAQVEVLKRSQAQAVSEWPVLLVDPDDFRRRWERQEGDNSTASDEIPDSEQEIAVSVPALPLEDFMTFRAACHDLLEEEDFRRVDRAWKETYHHTLAWLADAPSIAEESVSAFLRSLMEPASTFYEALLPVRAAQAALFVSGWFVRTDLDTLASRLDTGRDRHGLDRAGAQALRAYSTPRITCAAALLASDLSMDEVVELNVRDVGHGGRTVTSDGHRRDVPAYGAPLIEALVLERRLGGAHDDDPLFVFTPGTGKRHGPELRWIPRAMRNQLKRVEAETALLLITPGQRIGNDNEVSWTRRHGVMVAPL